MMKKLQIECPKDEQRILRVLNMDPEREENPIKALNKVVGYPVQTNCIQAQKKGIVIKSQ